MEHVLAAIGLKMQRCHACNARFARIAGSTILIQDVWTGVRKLGWLAAMVAGLLLVLGVMLWFLGRQAAGPPPALG